jgi:hypothetical protein
MTRYRAMSDVIACSLTPADLEETQGVWQTLFRLVLVSRAEVPGVLELNGPDDTLNGTGKDESAVREMWA